ncbi:MAG: DNA replication/repair protein RecF [Clostridiales Family XIII bacterium]|jgi:DNA replication and repair protein RecF|nr:DNA replication/repair protein RecF [Clostridiales Family XIII bacterium]
MIIETIELKDFRNYRSEATVFHEKTNIITGQNAQGKTNLIEAINLLSLGKSFRTRKESEMIRLGESACSVKGMFVKQGRPYGTAVELRSGGGSPHTYFVNGAQMPSVSDILGGVYTVVFSPEDLRIVKGEPEVRRRFLDRGLILLRPLYYHKLKKYRAVLKNRNALLKADHVSTDLLDVYDEQLAEAGAAVMEERFRHTDALALAAKQAGTILTDGGEEMEIGYRPSIGALAAEEAKEAFAETLRRGRERDLFLKSTEAGPHRDDISLLVDGKDLRTFGSQGQQRTAAVALRLAEKELVRTETGEEAILLLDDVMSELDAGRQGRLLERFCENQIFVTAAALDEKTAAALGAVKWIRIDDGKVI